MRLTLEERFWAKVQKAGDNECWLWTAGVTYDKRSPNHKYGVIGRGGRGAGNIRAHILSYQLYKGEIPEGWVVRHKCDITLCVNPCHLEIGTYADNSRDAVERGRVRNQNTTKDVCDSGHSLADAYVQKTGKRVGRRTCRTCIQESNARRIYENGKYIGRA